MAGEGGELLADGGGAGERHLLYDRMRNEIFGDFRWNAVDQIDDARGYSDIGEEADQFGGRRGSFLLILDDDRASRGQSDRKFAHLLVDRKIPGREGGHRAD